MVKYNLVIQGPVVSKGRTGKSFINYDPNKKEESVIEFNSLENIQFVLKKFSHLFEKIAIVTWEKEMISQEDVGFCKNCKLFRIIDELPVAKNRTHPTNNINLLRQFYSLKYGIESFSDENHIIKIRTDQYVDLEKLLDEYRTAGTFNSEQKIFVPFFSKNLISDFYFAGSKKRMIEFCNAILDIQNIPQINISATSVHHIMPFAIFYKKSCMNKNIFDYLFLKSITPTTRRLGVKIRNCSLSENFSIFINENFQAFSSKILYSTIWRGEQIVEYKGHRFELDLNFEKEIKLTPINLFVFLTPKTYFLNRGRIDHRSFIGAIMFGLSVLLPFFRHLILHKYQTHG